MQLREFISETIVQIINGIVDSQKQVDSLGAKVNPAMLLNTSRSIGLAGEYSNTKRNVYPIEFDIAVGEAKGDGVKAGIGILSVVLSAGAQSEIKSSQSNESRIKFIVPVVFPDHPGTKT